MSVLALDLALVRDVLLPGLSLTPGRAMMARVVSADEGDGGKLAIAGYLLDAELPKEMASGQSVRLVVREVTAERVLLAAMHEPATAAAQTPIAAPVELPGGALLRVLEDGGEDGESGGGAGQHGHALGLQLDLPGLGPLELRFGLDPGSVRAAIAADPGPALTQAQGRAGELREALARVCDRPAVVTVTARRQPLDLYA
jgi:hypothetical protein